jgi:hypothetical protein
MPAVALGKAQGRGRACLRLAAAIFVVLLCTLGLVGKAAAQSPPSVTGVSPNTGPLAGGTIVTIVGNFPGITNAVRFGGTQVPFAFSGPNQITATSPPGTGTVNITVTNDVTTSAITAADRFSYTSLRQLQVSATPTIAQIWGQAVTGAVENAIDAGFSDNPQTITPNGGGFTVQIPLGEPAPTTPTFGNAGGVAVTGLGIPPRRYNGPGSLANGGQGGNGAPPGTRLIDMPVIPLPPGSGMPPPGETRFVPDEVVLQFGAGTTPQQIAAIAQRFGLAIVAQQPIGVLGRSIYTFRITNGRSVRQVIGAVVANRVNAAVQPNYTFGLAQDQKDPDAAPGDPAQYIVQKLHLGEAQRITKGDNVVIAVIDSEIDAKQPDLAGAITERYDAGCGSTPPDAHGTGMAGAIASHGQLVGVAPDAKIIAICAFSGAAHPQSSTVKIIQGLDYAIQHGARIVNMSFAGPRDPALSQALQIAREKGVLLIAAAGNAGPKSAPLYPGADPSVLAVTATDENDRLFHGANQGKYVTIAAPGVDVLVPAPEGGVQLTTGTSVATANVSGVAALLIAHKPSLTPEEIREILVTTAKHLGSPGMNPQFGAGLVDPLKALEQKLSAASPSQQDSLNRFLASPDASSERVADGFAALGYADEDVAATKAPPPVAVQRDWLAWVNVNGADLSRDTVGSDLRGTQLDALAGLSRRLAPDLLVGVLAGYEHFDYSSFAFNGAMHGEGWTAGAYVSWRFAPHLRFDAAGAWADILANEFSGTASGSFTGNRWLTFGGITGTYAWRAFVLEPSARVYAVWEEDNPFTDSLGTAQAGNDFSTGRASGGLKLSYPFAWTSMVDLAPYVGLYGDYYFTWNDAALTGFTTTPLLQGWSARPTWGLTARFRGGAQLSAGGEYAGIGGNTQIWTWTVHGSVPF